MEENERLTEKQCREQIREIQFERIVISIICGFVVFRVCRIVKLIPDETYSAIMWIITFGFIIHNFVFASLMLQLHCEQKRLKEPVLDWPADQRQREHPAQVGGQCHDRDVDINIDRFTHGRPPLW